MTDDAGRLRAGVRSSGAGPTAPNASAPSSTAPPGTIIGPAQFAQHFAVSRETLERLGTYADLLKRWQRTINLVAPSTLGEVWHRHFADSAQLLGLVPQATRGILDLGSGAGFPGLVLAILLADPDAAVPAARARVRLVESDQRKAAFLREVARATGIAVDIISARIESIPTQAIVESTDVITSRALAPLPRLLELSFPFLSAHTTGLFLKGRDVAAEVQQARQRWVFDLELVESLTEADARVAVIRSLRPL